MVAGSALGYGPSGHTLVLWAILLGKNMTNHGKMISWAKYTLWQSCYGSHGPVVIDLPIKSGDFPVSFLYVYQRVDVLDSENGIVLATRIGIAAAKMQEKI